MRSPDHFRRIPSQNDTLPPQVKAFAILLTSFSALVVYLLIHSTR